MIAFLRGKLLEKHPNQIIVDTAGVGYDVVIPISTFSALPDTGAEIALRIHTCMFGRMQSRYSDS